MILLKTIPVIGSIIVGWNENNPGQWVETSICKFQGPIEGSECVVHG
jgi:hypothetical protein